MTAPVLVVDAPDEAAESAPTRHAPSGPAPRRAGQGRRRAGAPQAGRTTRRQATAEAASRTRARASDHDVADERSRSADERRPTARRAAPTCRLGVLWAAVAVAATAEGPVAVALVVGPVAAVAAATIVRNGSSRQPRRVAIAAGAAAVVPLAALGGPIAALAVGVAAVVGVLVVSGPGEGWVISAAAVGGPAAASASLVLAADASLGVALCLVSAICLFDMANYVVGTGRTGGVVGALAGLVTIAVFSMLIAAVVDPPFSGSRPWIMGGLVAVLAPLGVALARRLSRGASLPALRRLDSLLLAGPAWVVASHVLLR